MRRFQVTELLDGRRVNYGRAIKIVRTASGLSQAAMAERLSIGTSQLSLIEAGKRQPSLKVIHEIADAVNVPPHLITLLASGSKNLKEGVEAKDVEDLANALLRVLTIAGEQSTLPLDRKGGKRKENEEENEDA